MGHTMLIEDGIPKIKPLKTRVDAILKLDPPKDVKACRSFCGMVKLPINIPQKFANKTYSYLPSNKKRNTI